MLLATLGMLVSCGDDTLETMADTSTDDIIDNDTDRDTDKDTETETDTDTETETESDTETETDKPAETDPPVKKKSIDVYLILGQSNASGYTNIDTSVLSKLWPTYSLGVKNVIYSGRAESTLNVNTENVSTKVNEINYWPLVKPGYGRNDGTTMGPEVGMAKAIGDAYYNSSTGKEAAIIKYAHGGTALLNNTGGENAANGNWVSPTYAESKNLDYSDDSLTGGLYRDAVAYIENRIVDLQNRGYNDIKIKGIFWMQGESDRSNPTEYETAFKAFGNDLRTDLYDIMYKLTGKKDISVKLTPIMIGEISRTTGSASDSSKATNAAFIAKQNEIATKMVNVYVINSSKYDVNTWVNGENQKVQDGWHWNTSDMYNIGLDVGECILTKILKVK